MYDAIPELLRSQKAWVNVRKDSKIPMRTTSYTGASSVLPETWGSFEDAVQNVEAGRYDGIGYVFHGDGLVGIDIDTAKDDDGFFNDTTVEIIRKCGSYTELSRSRRGIHIILQGTLPFKGKNNRNGIEIYSTSRYFICTGNVVYHNEICHNQDAIDWMVDTYFREELREVGETSGSRIYTYTYNRPAEGKVKLSPSYPEIQNGCRNISLTSLAGQLHTQGYTKDEIRLELLKCNKDACKPPLPLSEVNLIVNSICKYQR